MPAKRPERVTSAQKRSGVELLLTETIPALGQQGDIVRVKAGYARNYLVPQGLGTVATAQNKRAVELHRQKQQAMLDARLANLRKLATEVSKYSVTLEANATEEGHLYGSITGKEISDRAAEGRLRHRRRTRCGSKAPSRNSACTPSRCRFHPEVDTEVKVWVVPVASIS